MDLIMRNISEESPSVESIPVAEPLPWLVYHSGQSRQNQAFCMVLPPNSKSLQVKSVPELRGMEIWASMDGWLLLAENSWWRINLLILWNPVSSDSITLPPLPYSASSSTIGAKILTTSPGKPGCRVLLFNILTPIIHHCQPGDERWSVYGYGPELAGAFGDEYSDVRFAKVGFLDGVLYTYTSDFMARHMVAIDVDLEHNSLGLRILGLGMPSCPRYWASENMSYFLESYGELYYVEICDQGAYRAQVTSVEVFRLEITQMAWVMVESLEDRSFFLASQGCCTSCLAEDIGGVGNQIHFTLPTDTHLYTYHLGDGRIMTTLPCHNLERPAFEPAWVKLNYSRPDTQVGATGADQQAVVVGAEDQPLAPALQNSEADQPLQPYFELDTLGTIARSLTALDYLHFRATCRLFRSVAPPVEWRTQSNISWESHFPYPMLVTLNKDRNVFRLTDPKNHDAYFINIPEPFRGTMISCSKDGYLLLAGNNSLFYYNPWAKKQGQLPVPPNPFIGVSFTSIPSSDDSMAAQIDGDRFTYTISFIRSGEPHWWPATFYNDDQDFVPSFNAPIYFGDGKFCCLGQKGNLAVIQIAGEGENWGVVTLVMGPVLQTASRNYLVLWDGWLAAVFVGQNGKWVKVFKLDYPAMGWVRVRNLGNTMLFVSHPSSFAATAEYPEMGNKVYFPRFYGGRMVYYSLQTERFHTHGSDEEIGDFNGTEEQLYSGWIQPKG